MKKFALTARAYDDLVKTAEELTYAELIEAATEYGLVAEIDVAGDLVYPNIADLKDWLIWAVIDDSDSFTGSLH